MSVMVEVTDRDCPGVLSCVKASDCLKGPVAVTQNDAHVSVIARGYASSVGQRQVGYAVSIEIAYGNCAGGRSDRVVCGTGKLDLTLRRNSHQKRNRQ